jgi:hypothetical protein
VDLPDAYVFFSLPKSPGELFGIGQVDSPPPAGSSPSGPNPTPEPKLLMKMMEMIRAEEGSLVLENEYPQTNTGIEKAALDVCKYLKSHCYLEDAKGSVHIHVPANLKTERVSVQYNPSGRSYKLFYWTVGPLAEKRHFTFDPENQDALQRLAEKSGIIYWHAERPGYKGNTISMHVGTEQAVVMEFRPDSVNIAVVGEGDKDTTQAELLKKAILDCSPVMSQGGSPRFNCFGRERLNYLAELYERQHADIKMALINEKSVHYKVRLSNTQ